MMPSATTHATDDLHETNRRLRVWLDSLLPAAADGPPVVASPQQMNGLLSELMRAGICLRASSERRDAELEQEANEYRGQVERLRALLPAIHAALLAERARLEQERDRVQSAAEWARASRQTL
jgi:hypothetical protein